MVRSGSAPSIELRMAPPGRIARRRRGGKRARQGASRARHARHARHLRCSCRWRSLQRRATRSSGVRGCSGYPRTRRGGSAGALAERPLRPRTRVGGSRRRLRRSWPTSGWRSGRGWWRRASSCGSRSAKRRCWCRRLSAAGGSARGAQSLVPDCSPGVWSVWRPRRSPKCLPTSRTRSSCGTRMVAANSTGMSCRRR